MSVKIFLSFSSGFALLLFAAFSLMLRLLLPFLWPVFPAFSFVYPLRCLFSSYRFPEDTACMPDQLQQREASILRFA